MANVLNYGAVGDGVTDDTTAINNAIATGENVLFPEGYVFLTQGNHQISTDHQLLEISGTVKKKSGTPQSLFVVQDQTEGVTFSGSGVLDGNRAAFSGGNAGSGVLAYRAIDLTVDGPTFRDFIEDGVKAINCPDLVISARTRFYNIFNIGVEIISYALDPRTSSAWSGNVFAPSGDIDGFYDKIDDGQQGASRGVGVDFSAASGALSIHDLRIGGRYRDVLVPIWSENNYAGSEAYNIVIDEPRILGNYRGSSVNETSDGIGLVGVKNSTIVAPVIRNVANILPPTGAETVAINLVQCDGISVIAPRILDDTGASTRMEYGIKINAGSNIEVLGGSINGASVAPILFTGSPTNVRIVGVEGATEDQSWGQPVRFSFGLSNVPANAVSDLLTVGGTDTQLLPAAARVVATVVRCTAVPSGNFNIVTHLAATALTALAIDQSDFGGGANAVQRLDAQSGYQGDALDQVGVRIQTDSSWVNTTDVHVDVWVDLGMKF